MTEKKSRSLSWSPEALKSFQELKEAFCTALTLCLPDPDLPFVVKVDASCTGLGEVLSQHQETPPQLHPSAAFSHNLSPAE
ncbi:MAG: ribonuclease H family protein [Aeromonas sp.]